MVRILSRSLLGTALVWGVSSQLQAEAKHSVSVVKAEAAAKSVELSLPAYVEPKLNPTSTASIRSYNLEVRLPKGAQPSLQIGSVINVSLALVRNRNAKAEVVAIGKDAIKLRLSNQVQQLDGQTLTASVPLKKENLFFVPSQAIYSPRGEGAQVFIFDENQTARLTPVAVIRAEKDGNVLVSAPTLSNAKVIFRGLENLNSGEPVDVIEKEEVQP